MPNKFDVVIGLEVHAQLSTASKLFCSCSTAFGEQPNSQTCPVCLGHPGTLPVLNREAISLAGRMILAVGGEVTRKTQFARKNYFYPDLPKGYQISQFVAPIGVGGQVVLSSGKAIRLNHIHLEEDAGKSLHGEGADDFTRVDLNRCGIPLIEIVTEPDISSPEEAFEFLAILRQIVQYIGVCSGDMEKGALRCDANISIRPLGSTVLGIRTEIKNLNSIRSVQRALECEYKRQSRIVEAGDTIVQATLHWDEDREEVMIMRIKEDADDYRYFPDPDILPVEIDDAWFGDIHDSIPELPAARRDRFVRQYGLPEYDAAVLTESADLADYYEAVAAEISDHKAASNWIMGEVLRLLKDIRCGVSDCPVAPSMLAELIREVETGEISFTMAKEVFQIMADEKRSAHEIIDEKSLRKIADPAILRPIIERTMAACPDEVRAYREGKTKLLGFFIGQIMKATQGKADPRLLNSLVKEMLDE